MLRETFEPKANFSNPTRQITPFSLKLYDHAVLYTAPESHLIWRLQLSESNADFEGFKKNPDCQYTICRLFTIVH